MGLSVAIAGGIILSVLMLVMMSMAGLAGNIFSIGSVTTQISDLENTILKTNTKIQELSAFSGSNVVNFDLLNEGNEKLWDYDNFNVIITYDAYTGGASPTRLTEHFTYDGTGAFDSSIANGTADFRIQRATSIIPAGSFTTTITEGIGNDFMKCQGDCFIKLVSSRNSGMGRTSGGENQGHDDIEVYISDDSGLTTSGGTVTFERDANPGGDNDRVTWEIWEYIGEPDGKNEMKVLDTGACIFAGGPLTCNGATILGGATDDNDVVVFVTGRGNANGGNNNIQRCLVISDWDSGTDQPVFTRGEAGNACDVSYAVVEWTGSNWAVQRSVHTPFSGVTPDPETIISVGEISRAFFHTQQLTDATGSLDDADNNGAEVELINPTTIEYRLPQSTADWDGSMTAVTWVISNSETDGGERMIVNHYNPPERSGGPEEENWQVSITPLSYTTNGTAITGMSGQSEDNDSDYPNGYLVARLTDSTTVDFWRAETGGDSDDEYTFQVTEFPRIFSCLSDNPGGNLDPSEWAINYITDDNLDPEILNANECAAITAKLSNPISSNGLLIITISTDNGIISTISQTIA